MTALLVALFFCLPPQLFLYPAAQRCSVILPVLPASWSQPFCSFFSFAYLMSFYGRRRVEAAAAQEEEEEEAGELLHRRQAHSQISSRSFGQSSKLSNSRTSRRVGMRTSCPEEVTSSSEDCIFKTPSLFSQQICQAEEFKKEGTVNRSVVHPQRTRAISGYYQLGTVVNEAGEGPPLKQLSDSVESPAALPSGRFSSQWQLRRGYFQWSASRKRIGGAIDESITPIPGGDRSWCCWQAPRGSQLMLLSVSWSLLLLLLSRPCLVRGASELLRVDGQAAYAEDWHRGNKGTDVLSQLSGINGRRYKHGEPPPGRSGEGFSGKFPDQPDFGGPDFSSLLESVTSEGSGANELLSLEGNTGVKAGEEIGGLEPSIPATRNLERLHFGSLIRDCLKVKCSPLASFDMKQPLSDETPSFISKAGSPKFQGPISAAPLVAIIPPFLEWGSQPVFAPAIASLTVVNTCNSTRLKVFQPFSTDVQFYTSGFEEKVVDPGDKLSIPIVFLPRAVGVADAMLIVQTSAGGFLVQAQGKGIGSPYKVQPLQGLRVTSGENLQYTVTLHNPHDEVLQVGEVYAWPSSFAESFLSDSNTVPQGDPCEREVDSPSGVSRCVESPTGGLLRLARDPRGVHGGAAVIQMRPPGLLEIEPHSSSPIADFEFSAVKVDKYSGSLHIKLSRGMQGSAEVLILPIDVQVGEAKGDASPVQPVVDVLEFGILTKEDQTSKMDVILYNPGTEAVQVEDVSPLLEDENIVRIEYRKGLVLPPDSEVEVAVVTYMGVEETVPSNLFDCHPRELLRDRMLIVRTNSSVSPNVEVPYRALVFHGSVDCDPARGSVGFVPERSEGNGGGLSVVEGGALSERRVHFVNDLSVPLYLFLDLERTAYTTNTQLLPSASTRDSVCCHESSGGHLAVTVGQISVAVHSELLYPLVQIGTEELHWVNVTNPSEKPLHVQVSVSSKAEASDRLSQQNGMNPEDPGSGCSQGDVSGSHRKVACDLSGNPSSVFSFADGAVVDIVVEPHGKAALGPVVFRPPKQCLWTGLLSLWNNLTQVEWVPLQGSGGSASLTFLDGEFPIDLLQLDFNVTQVTMISDVMGEQVSGFLDAKEARTICSQRVSRGFWAKNTGDINLDVTAVELLGGGCSAFGFEVGSCDGFSLAPGQRAELFVSFQPDFTARVSQRHVRLITSAGIVQIPLLAKLPEHIFPMCSEMAQPTNLERAFLYLAVVALVVVLGVFFRMLVQEMALSQDQASTNGLKPVTQQKVGVRQISPILFSPTHAVVVTKTSNSVVVSGRLKCSSGEPEVQSRTGDGTGASGPGRPKESIKGLVRALKGVADSFTATMGSSTGSEESKADVSPPPGLPGLRVKIPTSAALNAQKSNLGSPMREASSPSSTHFRKGSAEKRSHTARFDGLQAKIAPEPMEETLAVLAKQPALPKSPKSVGSNNSMVFTKHVADREFSQQLYQQTVLPVQSGQVTESLVLRSPRKGSQFNQFKQVLSPKAQSLSPKSQSAPSSSGVNDKDKNKRKKRRSNVGTVKHESVSKGRSGSSSPSSSPASPATPASPSRPVSPLLHSELQPNTTGRSPPGFSISKDRRGAPITVIPPLAKLDVAIEQPTGEPGNGKTKYSSNPPNYRRSESLSVDVASTVLREMAQEKTTDLSWSTQIQLRSGKGNQSAENNSDGVIGKGGVPKDWVTVARKAIIDTAISEKDEDMTHDRGWDRRTWGTQTGHGGSSGPTLTPSATFPGRQDRGSEWSFVSSVDDEREVIRPVGSSPPTVPASTMPPAARAPGAKIAKPFLDDSRSDMGWGFKGEYTKDGSNRRGEMLGKKSDGSRGLLSGLSSEDQRVYDIWGNHFGEISRCSTQQVESVALGPTALQSLAVVDTTPSFFSSFPQPSFPSIDNPVLSTALSGLTSGFSVFSQAPDIQTFCLPSTLFNSPKTAPSRQSLFPDVNVGSTFVHGRNGLKGHGLGGSLPGSPRKPRGPYSPPFGPSPMGHEVAPRLVPETTSDPSYSFWSGSGLQEVVTTAIHSRS